MTTTNLAVTSIAIALASLFVSYLSMKESGPRLKLKIKMIHSNGASFAGFQLEARNLGRGDVTIDLVQLESFSLNGFPSIAALEIASGPELPHRIQGKSFCTWTVHGEEVGRFLWRHGGNSVVLVAKSGDRRFPRTLPLQQVRV